MNVKDKNVLLVGCGDIGLPLGVKLCQKGANVWGMRRNPNQLPNQFQMLKGDVTDFDSLKSMKKINFDYVVITLTPTNLNDNGYRSVYVQGVSNILTVLTQQAFTGHLIFVSSTSVYHQNDGLWIDEDSPTEPVRYAGCRLLEAENLLRTSHISTTIVRFAGIYGPGRRRLIEQVLAKQGCPELPPLFTNRIHKDDCVGFLMHLIIQHNNKVPIDDLYLGVDSEPVSLWTVKQWLASQLLIEPCLMDNTVRPKRTSKRCSNRRMLSTGYHLLHPNFRSGYSALVKNER